MQVKLVATSRAGAHEKGTHVEDPTHVEKLRAGHTQKRYVQRALHPGEAPVENAPDEEPSAEVAAEPEAERAPSEERPEAQYPDRA
jgi:hypothetical protein